MAKTDPTLAQATSAASRPAARTGVQAGVGAFIVTGLVLFNVVNLTGEQGAWLGAAISAAVAFGQNVVEWLTGRKWLRQAPARASASDVIEEPSTDPVV